MTLTAKDLDDLRYARTLLEHPSLAARMTGMLGAPIEKGLMLLPANLSGALSTATRVALTRALDVAVVTMDDRGLRPAANRLHKLTLAATGAVGGAFGLSALAIELPLSTMVMLRSIADIGRSEGEQIQSVETRLACLEVFALGGRLQSDDAGELGYFAVRTALARAMAEAAQFIAERGVAREGAPVLVKLVAQIAARFEVVVSEKAAAQALPLIGAAGGAIVNLLFIDHFQDMARGHFIVRRLERAWGAEEVRKAYQLLAPPS
ncbi:MAG: EcsC family protein [Acidobacteriota bacterium]